MREQNKIKVTLDVDTLKELMVKSNFIVGVTPDYSYGRHRGLSDEETELIADKWLSSVVNLLDELTIDIE